MTAVELLVVESGCTATIGVIKLVDHVTVVTGANDVIDESGGASTSLDVGNWNEAGAAGAVEIIVDTAMTCGTVVATGRTLLDAVAGRSFTSCVFFPRIQELTLRNLYS